NSRLHFEKGCEFQLELVVDRRRAGKQSRTSHARTIAFERRCRGAMHARIIGEPQVAGRRQIDDPSRRLRFAAELVPARTPYRYSTTNRAEILPLEQRSE